MKSEHIYARPEPAHAASELTYAGPDTPTTIVIRITCLEKTTRWNLNRLTPNVNALIWEEIALTPHMNGDQWKMIASDWNWTCAARPRFSSIRSVR